MPSAMETPSTSLQVDELILDYLFYHCTSSLLTERRLRADNRTSSADYADAVRTADLAMKLVHSFNSTFTRLHPYSILPEPLLLRLRLCRFAAILLRRVDIASPSLAPSVSYRQARTSSWLSRRNSTSVLPPSAASIFASPSVPFSPSSTQSHTEALLTSLGLAASPTALYGPATLGDCIPPFMHLTAHLSARISEVSPMWMANATDLMLHATLESYLCHSCSDISGVDESFSYGLTEVASLSGIPVEEVIVNEMFAGNAGEIAMEFEDIRDDGLAELVPPSGVSLAAHFENLAKENPWVEAEERVVNYLAAVFKSQPRPVLAQLEKGELEGFDADEIRGVLARAGVAAEVWL